MASDYVIQAQSQSTELDQVGGNFHEVWQVRFKVTDGPAKDTVGVLSFPESDHTADVVKAAIEKKIADLQAVASLGG